MARLTGRAIHIRIEATPRGRKEVVSSRIFSMLLLAALLCLFVPRSASGDTPYHRLETTPPDAPLFAQQTTPPNLTADTDPDDTPAEELSIQWNYPPFLRSGDSFSSRVTLYNHQDAELHVNSELSAEGLVIGDEQAQDAAIPPKSETTLSWNMNTAEASVGHLVIRVQSDNEEINQESSVPILPGGSQQQVEQRGRLWIREWLISHLNQRATQLNSLIWISPSMLAMLLKDYAQWEGTSYQNNDQTANLLLVTTALWKAFAQAGVQEIPEAQPVHADLTRAAQYLIAQQNTDGGWGWWQGDESRPFQTAQVMHALFEAEATGLVDIPDSKEQRGLATLRSYWDSSDDLELRAYLLYVISQRRSDDKGLSTYPLWWERRRLSTPALAYLGMALDNLGALPDHRKTDVLNALRKRAAQTEHFVWWSAPDNAGELPGGNRYATALALQAFLRWSTSDELVGRSFDWLLRTGTSPTARIDFSTAQSIVTLAQAKLSQEPLSEGVVRVALEGIPVFEGEVDNSDLLKVHEVQLQDLRPGSNWIEILLEWPGPLYFDWSLQYVLADGELDAAHSSGGIILSRQFLTPERGLPAMAYEEGAFILVRLDTQTEETLHHVVIEDALPAGCRPVVGSLEGNGIVHSGLETSAYGDRVRFFLPVLPEGRHTFSYLLRADIPGKFLAMPASAYLTHNPARWGQSSGEQITISAQDAE